jgi:hypothetical protein
MGLPIIGPVVDLLGKVIDKFPDPKMKAEALQRLKELETNGDLAAMAQQADINKIEAASSNWFISGWRPAIGWVCAAGLAMAYILGPLVQWIIAISAVMHGMPFVPPPVDMASLMPILMSMLGMAGLRTYEKYKGVEGNR